MCFFASSATLIWEESTFRGKMLYSCHSEVTDVRGERRRGINRARHIFFFFCHLTQGERFFV